MILWNIRHTESVRGPHKTVCGPRASVWNTLVQDIAEGHGVFEIQDYYTEIESYLSPTLQI